MLTPTYRPKTRGFTLAELLIGLALMGLLAAMSIPALLNQTNKANVNVSTVKDTALNIAAAFAQYKPVFTTASTTLAGTIMGTGSTVAGTGTAFLTDFIVGDVISSNGQTRTIMSIGANTAMFVSPGWAGPFVGAAYARVGGGTTLANSSFLQVLPYLTYLKTDTTSNASSVPSGETALQACSSSLPCLNLHSGALLQYSTTSSFGGSTATNYITFALDPDGTGNTAGKINLLLYTNGRVVTGDQLIAGGSSFGGASPVTLIGNPSWMTPTEFGK